MEPILEREILNLMRQIEDLKRENQKIKTASNFLLYSIVSTLDEQNGDEKFSDSLKVKIIAELSKITMGGTSAAKHAINDLMQPPVKQAFGNNKPEPFLK